MRDIQDPSGFWLNSYWYNNGFGEEIRKHVGPVVWMAMAAMAYEKQYNDSRYRPMALKALDWSLQYKKANGSIAGGWSGWSNSDEPWSSTEHNIDIYRVLQYYASVDSSKAATYNSAASGVKTLWIIMCGMTQSNVSRGLEKRYKSDRPQNTFRRESLGSISFRRIRNT